MKNKKSVRCWLAMLLAVVLVFSGTASTAFAAETSTAASYTIDVREDIANGSITADKTTAIAGETVTLTVTADEGYDATNVGYWTVAEDGTEGDIVNVNVSETGTYSFTMPEGNVKIGAAFQDSTNLQLVGTRVYEPGTTSNPLTFYAAFGDSYLYVNEEGSWVRVRLDARFFDEKYAEESMVFTFELRQNDAVAYYHVLGTLTFTLDEIKAMNPELKTGDDGSAYYMFDLELPINEVGNSKGRVFQEGWYGYCYMAVTMDGWVNAKGEQASRYLNTSVDAVILAEGAEHLVPMVMLYNLSADTYTGYLFREYLKGEGITFLDITNDNLNQNIGYMAGWEGYEGVPPEEAYNPDTYDFTYLLYCNLSDVQVDAVLDALHRDNVSVKYSSVLKPYSAGKSFSELTVRIQKEDQAFKARFGLGLLLVEVDELVDAEYENHESWAALQKAWNDAYEVYTYDEELEAEAYIAARAALLEQYLAVTGKMQLAGKLEIVLNDNGDGTYTVSTKINKNEGDEDKDFKVSHNWFTGFERVYTETITVKAEDLYRISVNVSGIDNTYGILAAELLAPGAVEFTTVKSENTIRVTVKEIEETMNMPEVQGYVAELYLDGELVEKQEIAEAGDIVFDELETETKYVVKVYAYNLISYGTTKEAEVTTGKCAVDIYEGIENGIVSVDVTEALEGDTVTVTATPNEGYVLTQVAYRTVAEDGSKGKTTAVSVDKNGAYTFTMPASAIEVGAAFQPEKGAVLYNSSNSTPGVIGGSKETDYSLYISNWDVYVNVGDETAEVYLSFDKRFLEIENVFMNLEIRQYGDGGYKSVGSQTYDATALQELVKNAEFDEDKNTYTIKTIKIPVAEGKTYEEGLYQYCVVQFGCPDWTDAFGNALYRWTYTGVDATILGADKEAPKPIVWLYNLDANSYRGALVRQILEELGIEAGTVNHENLNQNIGYLVGWEGYEPVENPYSSENYDVEYMLMGNISDVEMDLLLEAMDENNIFVGLKSIPTAWTASKTFSELFDIMAEESEVLQEAVALDKMIYTAESLDEETYGSSEYWAELQKEIAEALVALQTDAEESEEGAGLYRNARLELEKVYLLVTGKEVLTGELELILEELEDGTYKVTAQLHGDAENPTFTYNWEPASSSKEAAAEYLIVAAEDLYKVSLDITGIGNSYGAMSATMYVPQKPEYTVTATDDSITVELKESEAVLNTPETKGYVVGLYLGEELIQSQDVTSGTTVVFNELSSETEYILKVNAYNLIGRSDIVEATVKTLAVSEDGTTGGTTTPDTEDGTTGGTTTPDTEDGTTGGTTTPDTEDGTTGGTTTPDTGDGTTGGTTTPDTEDGITGSVSGNGVPEGATLDVKELNATETKTLLAKVEKKHKKFLEDVTIEIIYDLNLLKDDKVVKPNEDGTVTVKLRLPEKLASSVKKLGILYIADDGSIEVIASSVKDGYITFTTDHFSNYAIYSYEGVESPKTGDNSYAVTWILVMMLGVAAVAGTVKNRKMA